MSSSACNGEAESNMKIYLLVMLMSVLLMAIRFTNAQEQQSNSSPSKALLSQISACAGSIFDVPCRRPSCCAGSITKLHQRADHASQD
jgi:hypothetical protein